MKSRFSKLICLLLALTMLASVFTVFASAESGEDYEEVDPLKVVVNRTFDEGWNFDNGISDTRKSNNFFIDYEENAAFDRNYFMRIEALNGNDGFSELKFSSIGYPSKKHTFVEFDIKVDDYVDFEMTTAEDGGSAGGTIIYTRSKGGNGVGANLNLIGIADGKLRVFNSNSTAVEMKDEWMHVIFDFDYSDETMSENYQSRVEITVLNKAGTEILVRDSRTLNLSVKNFGLDIIRFGLPGVDGAADARVGMSYCLDNLKAYAFADGLLDINVEDHGYGSEVDENRGFDIVIEGVTSGPTMTYYLNNSLMMKVGVNYALLDQERVAIYEGGDYGAPVKVDGVIYVPLEMVLEHVGYPCYVHEDGESYDITTGDSSSYITMGRDTATVDGALVSLTAAPGYVTAENGKKYPVVAMNDVEALFPGQYVTYDDMGLIIICEKEDIYNRTEHLTDLMKYMKLFIFELPTDVEIYEDVKAKTDNFKHPYLLADQAQYDRYAAIWAAEEGDENYDEFLKKALTARVNNAEKLYKKYSLPNGTDAEGNPDYSTYVTLNYEVTDLYHPYLDSNYGYDPHGGRLNETESRGNEMMEMAFAYAVTGDIKYFYCVYDMFICMGNWTHWGPGHFLDVADGAGPMAIAFDIIYNTIVSEGESNPKYSIKTITDIFYKHCMTVAMDVVKGIPCRFPRMSGGKFGYTSFYNTMANNWNAVCTSGVGLTCLVIMEANDQYDNYPAYILSDNLYTLMNNGMGQYAPDGSYVESPGYWAYGTNMLYRLLAALESSAGSTYGIFNCWGLDKTCYFALNAESSDYRSFNYHDGGMGQMDHSYFLYVGKAMKDPGLVTIRMQQLRNGKSCTLMDLMFYPTEEIDLEEKVELELDYYMEGIDAATSRSSWEKGAMFVGIIGGMNNASHGQIDSGDFVYHNGGRAWIEDLGADNYNVYGYFNGGAVRYRYYKMNAEGNNTLALTSDPINCWGGQVQNKGGDLAATDWYSNEYGSYARIDQTAVYGKNVVSAYRGMLVTNDRKTVVIQDEVSLDGIQSMLWSAHYRNTNYQATLSADKKTAYLVAADGMTLRLTLVSGVKSIMFRLMDTYEFFLTGEQGTVGPNFSTDNQGVAENDRSSFSKIAIYAKDVLSFKVAVVIELIDPQNEVDVGYKWTDMANWMPSADQRGSGEDVVEVAKRNVPKLSDIKAGAIKMRRYLDEGSAYGDDYRDYYRAITDVKYAMDYLDMDSYPSNLTEDIATYDACKAAYTTFAEGVKGMVENTQSLMAGIFG